METLKMHSLDGVQRNIELIGKLFPNAITEVKRNGKVEHAIDFDVLRQELSDSIVEGREERYQFTWPDKKKAMLAANAPITATLRPVVTDSVGKDGTPGGFDSENLYIEGDNLEVLKLLQETYLGKVKMIYIDPPYNTGNDFVYNDDFSVECGEWRVKSGDYDESGNRMVTNTESNGRFHTDWLNMIYPRLKIAKDLLADDGVIFISIDDNEQENLRNICNEIFGESNFLACLIWEKTRKNDARFFSSGHEYIVVYAKNQKYLIENNVYFREAKDGADAIYAEYLKLRTRYGNDYAKMQKELQKFYAELPKDHPAKKHMRYNKVDENGVWRDDNMSWPGGGGPTYDVIHPVTGKPCAVPPGGWRYSTPEKMQAMIKQGKVVFREDDTMPPIKKTYLVRKPGKSASDDEETVGKQVMGTYFYKSYLQSSVIMNDLLGKGIFEYSKDPDVIKRMVAYVTNPTSVILDFFSGSATTAHAVMQLNAEDDGHRKFIMVQLPEKTDEKSEAYKAGYKNICEIGKERIRRAGKQILSAGGQLSMDGVRLDTNSTLNTPNSTLDVGFRCLRLDSSNMENVYYTPEEISQQDMFSLVDNVKPDRTPEDLLFQVMLDLGVLLSSPIEVKEIAGKKVFNVAEGFLLACFDHDVTEETVKAIAQMKPYYAVFRDSSMANDSVATNFDQIFETYSPETVRKVL